MKLIIGLSLTLLIFLGSYYLTVPNEIHRDLAPEQFFGFTFEKYSYRFILSVIFFTLAFYIYNYEVLIR